jgi:IS30 family transposase
MRADVVEEFPFLAARLSPYYRLPKPTWQSTTLDNGSEHYLHTRLQEEIGMKTHFADPYCSSQQGTNESTDGLIAGTSPREPIFN